MIELADGDYALELLEEVIAIEAEHVHRRLARVTLCSKIGDHPTVLYFGAPVALISSLNEDGSANLAPTSSAWWLGWSCMLGLGQMVQTSANLTRTRECVINLPSADQVSHVDRLAMTTGRDPVPELKQKWGYRFERDKFGTGGFTEMKSDVVAPPRIRTLLQRNGARSS